MKKESKNKKQEQSSTLSQGLKKSFSVIIPFVETQNSTHILESIKHLKPEYKKSIEWILCFNERLKTEVEHKILGSVNKDNMKTISDADNNSFAEMIKKGVDAACNSHIIILNPSYLSRPVHLNLLFSAKDNYFNEDKLTVIDFEGSKKEKKHTIQIIAYPLQVAKYLFTQMSIKNEYYYTETGYKAKRTGLKINTLKANQPSPYQPGSSKIPLFKKMVFGLLLFINWFFIYPIKELKTKPHKQFNFINESSFFRFCFAVVAIILMFLMPVLSLDAGMSGDETVQYEQAENYYNYFASFGKDTSYKEIKPAYAYGMSFDTFTYAINQWFGIESTYEARHIINALAGWLAILFGGMITVLLCGWRAGIFTMLLFFFTPRFLGHSFNNPKDIPFAMAYVFSIYYILKLLREMPKPTKSTALLLAIGIAMAISIRIGGLLLIAYLFMALGLYYLITTPLKAITNNYHINRLKKYMFYAILIAAGGYFLGLILWPYALQNPIKNPLSSLELMTHFSTQLKQIFEGETIWSNKAPWYYAFKYLLISLPAIIFVGLILLGGQLKRALKNYGGLNLFILFFTFFFPIIYIIYKGSNVYGGWRHVLFTFPTLAVLAGIGFETLYKRLKNNNYQIILFILFAVLLYHPARHIIKNHPYEYIYYNELMGGVKNAYGKYETDYYYHSIREASEWLIDNKIEDQQPDSSKIRIATSHGSITKYYFRKQMDKCKVFYFRYYDRGNKNWDYAIAVNSYIDPGQLKKGIWPPSNTIHTITVDGQPICAILERKQMNDYYGYKAFRDGNYAQAIEHFQKAIKIVPDNETALLNLCNAYQKSGQIDKAIKTCYQCLKVYPDYEKVLNILGVSYLQKGQMDKALGTFHKLTEVNYKYYGAYYHMGYIYIQKNKPYQAVKYLKRCIEVNQAFKPAYITLSKVLDQLGRKQEAAQYRNAAKQLR